MTLCDVQSLVSPLMETVAWELVMKVDETSSLAKNSTQQLLVDRAKRAIFINFLKFPVIKQHTNLSVALLAELQL